MRLKLIAGNLVIVLLVGLGSYLVVRTQLRAELVRELKDGIGDDSELFARSWRAGGSRLADGVSKRAASKAVQYAFAASGEANRRRRAFDAAQDVSSWFEDPARGRLGRPHIVVIIDETGRVLARDTDPNRMFGQPLLGKAPALRSALERGRSRYAVWRHDDKLLQVGVAPVRNKEGSIVGALLVGYDLSNGVAQREARRMGHDLLFITEDGVYSTSTSVDVRNALQAALYAAPLETQTRAALAGKPTQPWSAELDGDRYVGMIAALPMARKARAGYVMMAQQDKQTELASLANVILWLTVLGVFSVSIYGYIVANTIMEPVEQMEDDLLAVINGRTDVRLEVDTPELGGLSYRINQLINLYAGVAEEDEDGRAVTSSGAWDAVAAGGPDSGNRPSLGEPIRSEDPDAAELAALADSEYYAKLYEDYLAAKQALGEDVSNIPQARFVERIRGNADHLVQKHEAKMVRFKVEVIGGQVNLRPVIMR